MSLDETCWYHPKIKREEGETKLLEGTQVVNSVFAFYYLAFK